MTTVSTIRPGFLVSLKTAVRGNCRYDRFDIEPEHITGAGELKARWDTERTITDPAEHKLATQVRGKARNLISAVCAKSDFGLLCPTSNIDNLNKAIADARKLVNDFNRTAQLTQVSVYSIVGRVEPNDAEAVRAIKSEIRDLVDKMVEGVKNLDAKVIRDAANKARSVGQMLPNEAQGRVKEAIAAARKAAKEIVKAGETASATIDKEAIRNLSEARTAFLDLNDDAVEIKVGADEARALDFEPEAPVKPRVERLLPNLEL